MKVNVSFFDEKTKKKIEGIGDTPVKLKHVVVLVAFTAIFVQNRTLLGFYRR